MSEAKEFKQQGMVDVSAKDVTKRTAEAQAVIEFQPGAYADLMEGRCPKGDVFATAKTAGIMAAKQTPALIPMCHPLSLQKVRIEFVSDNKAFKVLVKAEVVCLGRTGVEMEALTAASVAALTVYDMMKWSDKGTIIRDICLIRKTGGKSGDYKVEPESVA